MASTPLSPLRAFLLVGSVILSVSASTIPCDESDTTPATGTEWQPRTPEQTLYAYVRCLNDSSASIEQKINWVKWQPDTSPESQCYVKCVSEELGLHDPIENRFVPERFVKQAEAYLPDQVAALKTDAESMLDGVMDDNSCETVFYKYNDFYTKHHGTILRMFHGDHRDIAKTYEKLGDQVKQIGQTFVDFCEKRTGHSWSEMAQSCPSGAILDCIFSGFRWVTEVGEVDVNEIRRDYEAAGQAGADMGDYCESATGGSRKLYNCLRDKGADKLATVMEQRNQKTAFYFDLTSQEEPWKSAVEYANSLH